MIVDVFMGQILYKWDIHNMYIWLSWILGIIVGWRFLTAAMLDDTATIGRRSLINRQVETARMLELRHAEARWLRWRWVLKSLGCPFFLKRVLTDWAIFFWDYHHHIFGNPKKLSNFFQNDREFGGSTSEGIPRTSPDMVEECYSQSWDDLSILPIWQMQYLPRLTRDFPVDGIWQLILGEGDDLSNRFFLGTHRI